MAWFKIVVGFLAVFQPCSPECVKLTVNLVM